MWIAERSDVAIHVVAGNATANGTFNFSLAENVPDGHVSTINV